MAFEGPETRDYENVVSLNHAYLALLKRDAVLRQGLSRVSGPVRDRLLGLGDTEIDRLSATPFLLFSFHEKDDRYWDRVLERDNDRDLFSQAATDEVDVLISAALGFVWQLARRNPYALRLFCGATLYWCERIADLTFFRLLDAVRTTGDVPVLRLGDHEAIWQKLLHPGVHRDHRRRNAAQLAALQSMLTTTPVRNKEVAWPVAARRVDVPGLEVTERNERARS